MKWRVQGIEALKEFERDWDAINAGGSNLPIQDAAFFLLLLKEFGNGSEKLAVCEDATGPVAATVIQRLRFGSWQTVQPSQAPLGPWVQKSSVPTTELLDSLARSLKGSYLFSATQLDPDVIPRPSEGPTLSTLDYIDTARVTMTGTFADYWSGRGKNLQNNMKRQRNRLTREGTEVRFEWLLDVAQVGAAVDAFGDLESRGWKASEGTALHSTNAQGRFYRALLERYCSRDEASAFQYFYNGALVASDLCLHRDGVMILLKTTHDESQKTTSPSYLLRQESMKSLFDHTGFKRVEFYGRVMEWHTRWSNEFRRLYHLNCFRWALASKLYALRGARRPTPEAQAPEADPA
jgi:CelD/BcsL family acetyltransferase involved in cellulose biosynthesis